MLPAQSIVIMNMSRGRAVSSILYGPLILSQGLCALLFPWPCAVMGDVAVSLGVCLFVVVFIDDVCPALSPFLPWMFTFPLCGIFNIFLQKLDFFFKM